MAVNAGWTAIKQAGMATQVNALQCVEAVVDVTKLTGAKLTSGDWIQLMYIPAGSTFLFGSFEILTVDAGGGGIYIDTGTSANHAYHSAATLSSALYAVMDHQMVQTTNQSAAYIYVYSASADITTLKFRVRMYFDMRGGAAAQQ
jgi:hypothetical protein